MLKVIDVCDVNELFEVRDNKSLCHVLGLTAIAAIRILKRRKLPNEVDTAIRLFPWFGLALESMIHATSASLKLRSK